MVIDDRHIAALMADPDVAYPDTEIRVRAVYTFHVALEVAFPERSSSGHDGDKVVTQPVERVLAEGLVVAGASSAHPVGEELMNVVDGCFDLLGLQRHFTLRP
jgi:hypothetical protein